MIRVTLPTAAAGIITAVILGIARVAGETAPLALTMTGNNLVNTNVLHGQMGALPLVILGDAIDRRCPSVLKTALAGAFFVLFSLIVVLNLHCSRL